MDEVQRDEPENELANPSEVLLPLESVGPLSAEDDVVAADEFAGIATPLEIEFSGPGESEELLAQEIEGLKQLEPLETNLRIEPSAGDVPLSPQEAVFGKALAPGRLNVGFQPHARKIPIAYEPQPSFETPEDVASPITQLPGRPDDGAGQIRDMVYRHGDSENGPRVQLLSDSRPAQEPAQQSSVSSGASDEPTAPGDRGQTLPRLLITVSMANTRSVFQDCIERASKTLGAKFHAACQATVNDYARDRRAAERAANRYG